MTQLHKLVHCDCNLAHEPAQALADLLRAAVEIDEIAADFIHPLMPRGEYPLVRARLDALRAAVRKLS